MQLRLNTFFLALALVIASASCAPSPPSFVIHESVPSPPTSFAKSSSTLLTSQNLTLRIQLAQNNIAGLEQELYAVSTPGGAKHGQHLSAADVASYVAPSTETSALVNAWLSDNGMEAKPVSNAGDWVEITIPLSQANAMLNAEFAAYEDANGNQVIRTLAYSIPSDLQGHIDLIHPTVNFPVNGSLPLKTQAVQNDKRRATAPSSCSTEGITPTCLQDLYSIPITPATNLANSLWVSGFEAEYADSFDVSAFITQYRPDIPATVNTSFNVVLINGGENQQFPLDAGAEALLDMEYTIGVATGVPATFLSVGPDNFTQPDPEFLQDVLVEVDFLVGLDTVPVVLTTSYEANENELTPALANSICNAYMQLGARGTSVLFSSGDGGVAGNQPATCTSFVPTFPGSCPFVTTVGGTQIVSGNQEEAASFSTGGFSNVFAQPSYQSSAVSSYLSFLGSTNAGLFNASGRAIPDVSANAINYEIFIAGITPIMTNGTSASSPTFASVVALINDQLLNTGKSPLGFLNPFLYANADALNDITTGSNPGCGTNGFSATEGWDPVTGLGTPNFPALLAAAGA